MVFSGKRPKNLGVQNRKLAPCPKSPNCVSSQSKDKKHYVAPFLFKAAPDKEFKRLKQILSKMSSVKIIEFQPNYLHAECKTPIMGFVDDLEFYWDNKDKICHVRSASRSGYSDFGKNKKRIEQIRKLFER